MLCFGMDSSEAKDMFATRLRVAIAGAAMLCALADAAYAAFSTTDSGNQNWNAAIWGSPASAPVSGQDYVMDSGARVSITNVNPTNFFGGANLQISPGAILTTPNNNNGAAVPGTLTLAGGAIHSTNSSSQTFAAGGFVIADGTTNTIQRGVGSYSGNMLNLSGPLSGSGTIQLRGVDGIKTAVNSPLFTGIIDAQGDVGGQARLGSMGNLQNISDIYLRSNAVMYLNIGWGNNAYGNIHLAGGQISVSDTGGGNTYGTLRMESESEISHTSSVYDGGLAHRGTITGAARLILSATGTKTNYFKPNYGGAALSAGSDYSGEIVFVQTSSGRVMMQLGGVDLQAGGLSSAQPGAGSVYNASGSTACTLRLKPGSGTNCVFSGNMFDGSTRSMGLVLDGSGTQQLNGTNTYTGPTIVSNGTLRVNGVLGTGTVSVASGGTFGGSAALGGSLVFADNARLACDFGATTNETVQVAGDLVLGAHTRLFLSKSIPGRPYAGTEFLLIKYSGADPSPTAWSIDFGDTGWGGGKVTHDIANKRILLKVVGKGLVVTLR